MSDIQIAVVTAEQFAIYARDGKLSALATRISELREKRSKAVYELATAQNRLALAEAHVHLIDFHLEDLCRQRLSLLQKELP